MTNSPTPGAEAPSPRIALAAAIGVLGFAALWPLGAVAEAWLALVALGTLVLWVAGRLVLPRPALWLAAAVFAGYWLPQLLSAPDAINPGRAWREVAVDLRYLPFVLACAAAAAWRPGLVTSGLALLAAAWVLDGLVQAGTGWSLGGPADPVRLTGILGADNPKLGQVLAALSPFLLLDAQRRLGLAGWLAAALAMGVVVVLAGARAAWLSYALVLLATGWTALGGGRRALLVVLAGSLALGAIGLAVSDRISERLGRTLAVLSDPDASLDDALSGRLPIWRAALAMAADHPVNGVGVRGFREAWPQYSDVAPEDQAWGDSVGALHAHHWMLEVLAETGGLGLSCWLLAIAAGLRAWRRAGPAQRTWARPAAIALLACLFPINTHLAVYSTFWGGLLLLLAGVYAGLLWSRQPLPLYRHAGLVLVGGLVARLPQSALLALGRGLARLGRPLLRRRARIAERNLALCFPTLAPDVRQRLGEEALANAVIGGLESLRAWFAPTPAPVQVRVDGLQHLRDALACGRGVLVLAAHFTSVELACRLLSEAAGERMGMLVRRHGQPAVEAAIDAGRRRHAGDTVAKKDLRGLMALLGQGRAVVYAPDQDFRHGHVFVPFFGIPAATLAMTARIAARTGAAVLPFWFHREPDGSYVLELEPPLPDVEAAAPAAEAARYVAAIEARVRQHPAQYLWVHRRFQTRPEGEPPLYA